MRRIVIVASLAAVSVAFFTAASNAESRQRYNDYYYKSYDTAYAPVCVARKIRTTDDTGNPVVKKVRICR